MNTKQNLHTHSIHCDGKNTLREIIETAINKGFGSIGFSGHSYTPFASQYCMSKEGTEEYIKEIGLLKKEYSDKIKIFCGIEREMFSDTDLKPFDYVLGAVHYLKVDGKEIGFDRSQDVVENVINNYFGGDGMAYAKKYYETLSHLPEIGRCDIICHFDLVTKHSEKADFFDWKSDEYLKYAVTAAETLVNKIPLFEVNTGAIARGYRTTPYPTIPILKELKRLGFGAVISSDCHDMNYLDCNFNEATQLLEHCGFKERYILTENGFKAVGLWEE